MYIENIIIWSNCKQQRLPENVSFKSVKLKKKKVGNTTE
jgi:hypothetical protein